MPSERMLHAGTNRIAAEAPRRGEKSALLSSVLSVSALSAPSAHQPGPKRDCRRRRTRRFLVFPSASRRLGGEKNLTHARRLPGGRFSSQERVV